MAAAMVGQDAAPTLPFIQKDACPYEHCRYGDVWTAHRNLEVYDTWTANRRVTTQLAEGESAVGITGIVVTSKPDLIRMDRDYEQLRRGDAVLAYGASSEGFSTVWFKGHLHLSFDISFAKRMDGSGCGGEHCAAKYEALGMKTWWVELKLVSGKTGWVQMDLWQIPVALY